MAYASAIMIGTIGIAALTVLTFSPTAQSRQVALILPPWRHDGLAQAAATGLAIIDTHWRRHVFILDTQGDPTAVKRLRDQGYWLLDATGTAFCSPESLGETT